MEGLSKKVATNDKILENMNNRMDSFAYAIKNQHSFNKMIESQIAQLAAAVPFSDKGKILGQSEDLETAKSCRYSQCSTLLYTSIDGKMDRLYLARKEDRSWETCHPHCHWTSHLLGSCL